MPNGRVPRLPGYVVALGLAALCGLGAFAVTRAVRSGGSTPVPPEVQGQTPEAIVTSPTAKWSEHGKLRWKILLDKVELSAGGTTIGAQNVREGIVYDASGKPALRVTADRVVGNTSQRNFEMTGKVVVTSPKGIVITTERVQWFDAEQRIHCPVPVVMKTKSLVFTAAVLDYMVNTDVVNCSNQVRGYSGNNRFSCRSLTYNLKTEMVETSGGLQMVLNVKEARKLMQELRNP